MSTTLTGVKPTGIPHLGNYLGAMRPAIQLAEQNQAFLFIADYHALTFQRDGAALSASVYDVAAAWLACGLDPEKSVIFRQSDVPEVCELSWILSCVLAAGQLERGHAYKDALAKNQAPNAGLLFYPVLMAADILLYDTDQVPVGKDQKQHLELTRDLASRINHHYGEETLVIPEAVISEAPLVPGIDGEKMSKSRNNGISLFDTAKRLRKTVMGITTSSESMEEPKQADGTTLYELTKLVDENVAAEMKAKLAAGNFGWGHAKQMLVDTLEAELGPKREKFLMLRADEDALDRILKEGAERARIRAEKTMNRVRKAVGLRRH